MGNFLEPLMARPQTKDEHFQIIKFETTKDKLFEIIEYEPIKDKLLEIKIGTKIG
jgi:hypothetical protein